jgi:biopolymer transport protein ExbD
LKTQSNSKITISGKGDYSVEGIVENNVKATMHKIVDWLAGEPNKRILAWVDADDGSFRDIIKFMDICASNGWKQLEESPFEYATPQAVEIANSLYERAMKNFKGG